MNNPFGHTFEGIVVDVRIITMTIVRIRIAHLTHFILQTAVGRMMHSRLPPELGIEDNIWFFLSQLRGLSDSFFCSMWYWLQDPGTSAVI